MEEKRYAEPIDAADYEEPRCPLCMESPEDEERVHSIDMRRVMEKLDDYLAAFPKRDAISRFLDLEVF